MIQSFRHSRESGNPANRNPREALNRYWIPAFAGMTILLSVLAAPIVAQDSLPSAPYAYRQLDDPEQEARAQELMETLRCLACQSQSVADSDAPMAGDMRHQVRTRIAAGEEPEAIRAWMIERYGDYISYTPRMTASTWPLFVVPLFLLAALVFALTRRLGRKP
jgi:cytochrome c-type biogenesis protein CcmH